MSNLKIRMSALQCQWQGVKAGRDLSSNPGQYEQGELNRDRFPPGDFVLQLLPDSLSSSQTQALLGQLGLSKWIDALQAFRLLLLRLALQPVFQHRLGGEERLPAYPLNRLDAPFVKGLDGNAQAGGHL